MYINKVMLYGNLTRDPEIKTLPNGTPVANFSIATNRVYKDRDGAKQEQTEFHNIVVFSRTAETVGQYLKKGSGVYVEGRLQTRSWEKDTVKQYRTEIIAETVQFGPRAGAASGASAAERGESKAPANDESFSESAGSPIDYPADDINPDDIPF